ncbi:helix-turn-helix domain-containing protein [Vibrio jasicida]|uniref:helix-turn-helix domain-containing protein n=1 Tax=Vibrio jasicida TaxID=766224 RepID=UPI000CE43172|nr:helix-turn-helix transcriptional regulator [Vibrio jasicida]
MKENNLRALRERAGYKTASDFAKAVGMPISSVTSHENGNRKITETSLQIYSEFLNVLPESILKRDALVVHDRILNVISAFCTVQKRNRYLISKDDITKIMYEIERNNIKDIELELFIESCLII